MIGNYEEYLSIIRSQISKSADSLGIEKWSVDDEQAFILDQMSIERKKIYMVVSFGQASVNFGSSTISLTITAYGTENGVQSARALLTKFAVDNNLKRYGDTQFILNTPSSPTNFNEAGTGFRSIFYVSGALVVSDGGVYFDTLTWHADDGDVDIPVLDFSDDTTQTLNPQVYGNTNNRTKSYATAQTYSFVFTTYSISNPLISKINDIKYSNSNLSNTDFEFSISLSSGSGFKNWKFKLQSATFKHSIGNVPSVTLVFTL